MKSTATAASGSEKTTNQKCCLYCLIKELYVSRETPKQSYAIQNITFFHLLGAFLATIG
jgi:hypothetical protein